MKVKSKNITNDNFKRFGTIVKLPAGKTTSEDDTYKFWSNIANYQIEGKTEIGICTVFQQAENVIIGVERHLKTPEILIPIDAPFAVPLLVEGDPDDKIESFVVGIGEAIVINDGVWHGACLPIGKTESSYFVIFRLNTPKEDVMKKEIKPVEIEL